MEGGGGGYEVDVYCLKLKALQCLLKAFNQIVLWRKEGERDDIIQGMRAKMDVLRREGEEKVERR